MSVHYEVKEHLVVKNSEENWEIADLAIAQLGLLGGYILLDRAGAEEIAVVADGKSFRFSGKTLTEDYHKMIRALNAAENFEITSSYWYRAGALGADPGPFDMVEHLQEAVKEDPNAARDVFYSMWNSADCANTAGVNVAFGEKNGNVYTGNVDFKTVDSIPDGEWYTPLTAVVYDCTSTEGKDLAAIESVCKQMCEFSSYDDLTVDENSGVSFALNNLCIKSDAQLKTFMALCAKLIELTDGECCLLGELADIGAHDVSILHFDVEADGTYELKLAAIN